MLSDAGNQVTLWARRRELADKINMEHRNPDYFPDLPLPASLKAVSDPHEAINRADFVVLAVPSQAAPQQPQSMADPRERHRGESGGESSSGLGCG